MAAGPLNHTHSKQDTSLSNAVSVLSQQLKRWLSIEPTKKSSVLSAVSHHYIVSHLSIQIESATRKYSRGYQKTPNYINTIYRLVHSDIF